MKLQQANDIIAAAKAEAARVARGGYRVHFERRERSMLISDYFPERDEDPIPDEEQAWALAEAFADADPRGSTYVNIYVISAADWTPVPDYNNRRRNTHPAREAPVPSADTAVTA